MRKYDIHFDAYITIFGNSDAVQSPCRTFRSGLTSKSRHASIGNAGIVKISFSRLLAHFSYLCFQCMNYI